MNEKNNLFYDIEDLLMDKKPLVKISKDLTITVNDGLKAIWKASLLGEKLEDETDDPIETIKVIDEMCKILILKDEDYEKVEALNLNTQDYITLIKYLMTAAQHAEVENDTEQRFQ